MKSIRMATVPLTIGAQFWGDRLERDAWGEKIVGQPFQIVAGATREEFIAQYAPGELTEETQKFLDDHTTLYFYRTRTLTIEQIIRQFVAKETAEA